MTYVMWAYLYHHAADVLCSARHRALATVQYLHATHTSQEERKKYPINGGCWCVGVFRAVSRHEIGTKIIHDPEAQANQAHARERSHHMRLLSPREPPLGYRVLQHDVAPRARGVPLPTRCTLPDTWDRTGILPRPHGLLVVRQARRRDAVRSCMCGGFLRRLWRRGGCPTAM